MSNTGWEEENEGLDDSQVMIRFKYDYRHKAAARFIDLDWLDHVCECQEMAITLTGATIPVRYHIAPRWFAQLMDQLVSIRHPRQNKSRRAKSGPAQIMEMTPDRRGALNRMSAKARPYPRERRPSGSKETKGLPPSGLGLKKPPYRFIPSYWCMNCGRKFYDNPDLQARKGIKCPFCFQSYIEEPRLRAERKMK